MLPFNLPNYLAFSDRKSTVTHLLNEIGYEVPPNFEDLAYHIFPVLPQCNPWWNVASRKMEFYHKQQNHEDKHLYFMVD